MSLKALSMTFSSRVVNAEASIQDGVLVLHVGCGDGYLDPYLCDHFSRVVGVDINFVELQSAAGANRTQRAEYALIDGFVLPFESGVFDAIVSIDVLEHAEDDVALVIEMSRVLKAGGMLTITAPNADYPVTFDPVNYVLESVSGRHLPLGMWGFGHRRLYKVESLCELLETAGLGICGVTRMSHALVGLIENAYLLNLVQPLTKSSAANRPLGVDDESGGMWRKLGTMEPPSLLKAVRDSLIGIDKALFGTSLRSINFLVSAQKT
ncbi:MAG TPA: class I SAM-dependent methyltransferase [Anaerolineae bacterium]|nr:class I SAM-dependent methyltransferase [Anaerolineae bacterium]